MKSKPYILNLKNIREGDLSFIGREALEATLVMRKGILLPPGFVITSYALDDFFASIDVTDKINEILSNVRPYIKQSAKDASDEITKYISKVNFTKLLTDPILSAYRNLLDNNEQPIVTLRPSNILDPKYIPLNLENKIDLMIKGENELLEGIRQVWLSLFTTEAIEFRTNNYYKGDGLKIGVIIQKKIRAEVSGTLYSLSTTQGEGKKIEIRVVYGTEKIRLQTSYADIYKIDFDNHQNIEKTIIPQDKMIVEKIKFSKGEEPFYLVEISDFWKKNQKMEDEKIVKLAEYTKIIKSIFHTEVQIEFSIEAGSLYVLSMDELAIEVEEKKQKIENIKFKHSLETSQIDKKKVDISKLSLEVQAIAEGRILPPDLDAPKFSIQNFEKEDEDEINDKPLGGSKLIMPNIFVKGSGKETRFTYFEEYEFLTSIYLNISSMKSKYLSILKYFSGSFFDATEMLLTGNVLPEEVLGERLKLNTLVDQFSLNISTASKAGVHKPLIFQFSTISEYELKLLGIKDGKYKYNYDERFLDYPESMSVESLAVKKARDEYGARNIKISFSGIRSIDNLKKLKKIVLKTGIKHSSVIKHYVEIALPSLVFELEDLEVGDIDGIIVNYNKLLKLSLFRNDLRDVDNIIGMKLLNTLKKITIEKNIELIIRIDNFTPELIGDIVLLSPNTIIFGEIPDEETIKIIKSKEIKPK